MAAAAQSAHTSPAPGAVSSRIRIMASEATANTMANGCSTAADTSRNPYTSAEAQSTGSSHLQKVKNAKSITSATTARGGASNLVSNRAPTAKMAYAIRNASDEEACAPVNGYQARHENASATRAPRMAARPW